MVLNRPPLSARKHLYPGYHHCAGQIRESDDRAAEANPFQQQKPYFHRWERRSHSSYDRV